MEAEKTHESQYVRSLIEASLDPLVTISAEGKITDVNQASIKVTGVSRENLIGTDFSDYFTEPKKAQEGYLQVFEKGSVIDYPLTIKHVNGNLIDVLYNASVYKDDKGKVLGVFAAARDVTKQKQASQYSRSLIEASLDPLVTISAKGKITDVNEASIKVTGVAREKLIGTDFSNYFTDSKKAQEGYQMVFDKGSVIDYPLTIKHVNGNLTDVLYNASVYKDEKGNILGVFAAARDVTEQKWAIDLRLANKELAYQNGEKEKRANELYLANIELAFQNDEKEKRAAELFIANKELIFQTKEKEKRAAELVIADIELEFQNKEKEKREIANKELKSFSDSAKLASQYSLSLIEASRDPLVTISAEGKITDMNEATVKITGLSRESLKGTDFFDYFTDQQKAQEVYQEIFAKGSVSDSPLTLRHKEGKLTDVLFNGSVYKNDKGTVIGVVIVARDVTDKKRIEANLEKSLKEISGYKMALEESSIVAITDQTGKINYVNDNFCKISKYTREELIGQDHRLINSGYHPKEFMLDLWVTISSGKIWRGEVKNMAKDGSSYWVDTTIVPFQNEKGKVYQYVAIRTDITAKKLLSQYSLSLIEASRDPLVAISPEGKITDMNEATVKITGVDREQLRGSYFKDYFTDPQKASEVYKEVFKKGFVSDYPLTIRDHKLTNVLFNGSVYKDDKGNVIGAVIVARDITEQKRTEKELTEAKVFAELATEIAELAKSKAETATQIAEGAVKAKQQFLSNMSHEIRTPMNAIIGFTKVVLKTNLTIKQKEYLSAIKVSGDALIVLINDILDLAKVDAGKMTFELTPFKISNSISAMLHLFEPKIQEKNLKLITEYDSNIPEVLLGDSVRLHQIILNLVSNAVKFTSEGSITVKVKLLNSDEENVTIEFTVSDTGIGIEEDKIKSIFDDFQQASSGTSRLYGGTGLGLAIVKNLVENQGGTVNVKSNINEGSMFSFTLKFKKTNAYTLGDGEKMEVEKNIKNIKVLVVEDIALNQLLMKTLLDDFGFDRDIAGNGKIAIEKLQLKSYDIILMDLQMPIMNGFEATEYIRNTLNSKIPIIALTADVTTSDLEKCRAVGMDDYIAKPVDEEILYEKIVGLVKKPTKKSEKITQEFKEIQKIKCIDLNYLMKRTKSNPLLMMEMISLYLEQTPPLITAMKEGLLKKDWASLQSAVHKMIPSFSIMGISTDYENMARKIQEYTQAQEINDEIHDLVLRLENICIQACSELEEELNRIKSTK